MDAVTYPDPRVSQLLDERFVPIKLTITEDKPATQQAMRDYSLVWTPTLVFLDENGRELRRSVGYLPPNEMVAELEMGLGTYFLAHEKFGEAYDCFQRVVRNSPDSQHVAEAMYWSGMARYKRDDDQNGLAQHWHELRDRFPDSAWWQKASFIDR
jgi:hypothetical protein